MAGAVAGSDVEEGASVCGDTCFLLSIQRSREVLSSCQSKAKAARAN